MIGILLDLEKGIAKLERATTIKAGVQHPVHVTLSADPGSAVTLEVTLGTQAAPPAVMAYLGTFEAENATLYTGQLNANDTRLVDFMAAKANAPMWLELSWTIAGETTVAPNMPVTVEPKIGSGPPSSEGGPVYLTEAQSDARYLQLVDVLSQLLGLDLTAAPTSNPGGGKVWRNGGVLQVGA